MCGCCCVREGGHVYNCYSLLLNISLPSELPAILFVVA